MHFLELGTYSADQFGSFKIVVLTNILPDPQY